MIRQRTIAMAMAYLAAGAWLWPWAAQGQTPAAEKGAASLTSEFEGKVARGEAVVAEIGAIHARDQYLRALIIESFKTIKTEATRKAFIDGTRSVFDRVDGENTRRLIAVLDTISWSHLLSLSPRAADQALSVISHTNDNAFKKRMLAIFEPLVMSGQMEGQAHANLFDDLALEEGRLQRYGADFDCIDGKHQPRPTEDVAGLDARKAKLGMMPMAEYSAQITKMYGECPVQRPISRTAISRKALLRCAVSGP